MREELVNKISKDILATPDTTWDNIFNSVNEYSVLLNDNIRNFYEIQMSTSDCPLFALCYFLKKGKDNFGLNSEEFNEVLNDLVIKVDNKFAVSVINFGYRNPF